MTDEGIKISDELLDSLLNKLGSEFDIYILDSRDIFVYTCIIVFVTSYLIFIRNIVYKDCKLQEEILPSAPSMDTFITTYAYVVNLDEMESGYKHNINNSDELI
jgi:hypothetical protein